MIANSDQFVECLIDEYLAQMDKKQADGIIMSFEADDPKWSFCRMRENGTVSEVVEKEVVSNTATVGIYNFKHGKDFVNAAEKMISQDIRVKNEYYVAPVYNLMIANGSQIITYNVGKDGAGMYGLTLLMTHWIMGFSPIGMSGLGVVKPVSAKREPRPAIGITMLSILGVVYGVFVVSGTRCFNYGGDCVS